MTKDLFNVDLHARRFLTLVIPFWNGDLQLMVVEGARYLPLPVRHRRQLERALELAKGPFADEHSGSVVLSRILPVGSEDEHVVVIDFHRDLILLQACGHII